jgi:hypothetical protein
MKDRGADRPFTLRGWLGLVVAFALAAPFAFMLA